MIRKKEIVEHVVSNSGLRKRDVREALDQAFAFMRSNLLKGEEIDCPPLGKVKVRVQGPNSDNPKLQFRVVPRREARETAEVATEIGASEEPPVKNDPKIHQLALEKAEG